jgi:hypothetical protein
VDAFRHISQLLTALAPRRAARALGGALLAVALCSAAAAQTLVPPQRPVVPEPQDDRGHFEIVRANTELRGGVYFLTARINYRLSTEASDALHSGVPLGIRLDLEIVHPRRWWFDNDSAALRQAYQLEYHALSERYIVLNVNSGEQASFGTLAAALAFLGNVEGLPLIDAPVLEEERDYDVRLRAVLDQEQFPGPLRLLAFWRRDWSIASDWYRWRLASE